MAEAVTYQAGAYLDYTPTAAKSAGDVVQVADGRAGVCVDAIAASAKGSVAVCGVHTVTKATDLVVIEGARMWWDHSANAATPVPPLGAGDKDFYLGVAREDATASADEIKVDLNKHPHYEIDSNRDNGDTIPVLTAGTPFAYNRGGMLTMGFSATAEAQKLDWISNRSFPLGSNWVFEAIVEVKTTADADVADLSIGVANATHASDADSITESAFFHYDLGADLNIDAESDDGTVEVAATDTTKDFAEGTPDFLCLDGRDPTNVKYYVNGVEVLAATANLGDIQLATGPLKALLHLEKSANDSPGEVKAWCGVRFTGNE